MVVNLQRLDRGRNGREGGIRWENVIDRRKRMRVNEGKRGGSERRKETQK